jgi:copper transport protein
MKIARIACALALVSWGALAFAHSHLVKADPADGAVVKVAPARFVLSFNEPAKLTMLALKKDAEAARKVGPLPTEPSAQIEIPAPKLEAGKYVLTWRVISNDGHVMPGKLSFTVGPSPASTSAPGSTGP